MLAAATGITPALHRATYAIPTRLVHTFGRALSSHVPNPVAGLKTPAACESEASLKDHGITAVKHARNQIIASNNLFAIQREGIPPENERRLFPGLEENPYRYVDMEDWELMRKRAKFVSKHVAWLQKQFGCGPFEIPPASRLRKIFMTEELNKLCPIGNCSPLAETAFLSLYRQGLFPLEMVYQFNEHEGHRHGHAFVLVNRDKNSELAAHEQWGDKCLLVDAWVPAVLFSDQYVGMKEWLPQFFNLEEVYSVIRLEEPLKEGERPALKVKSKDNANPAFYKVGT